MYSEWQWTPGTVRFDLLEYTGRLNEPGFLFISIRQLMLTYTAICQCTSMMTFSVQLFHVLFCFFPIGGKRIVPISVAALLCGNCACLGAEWRAGIPRRVIRIEHSCGSSTLGAWVEQRDKVLAHASLFGVEWKSA